MTKPLDCDDERAASVLLRTVLSVVKCPERQRALRLFYLKGWAKKRVIEEMNLDPSKVLEQEARRLVTEIGAQTRERVKFKQARLENKAAHKAGIAPSYDEIGVAVLDAVRLVAKKWTKSGTYAGLDAEEEVVSSVAESVLRRVIKYRYNDKKTLKEYAYVSANFAVVDMFRRSVKRRLDPDALDMAGLLRIDAPGTEFDLADTRQGEPHFEEDGDECELLNNTDD